MLQHVSGQEFSAERQANIFPGGLPSVTSSTSSAIATAPPCWTFEDPDNGQKGAVCMCSNGATIPVATTTNSAGSVDNCPWATLPPQALTTTKPTTTNNKQYQYTYTDESKRVIECQTFSTAAYAGYAVSMCKWEL
jgi:hypothetical protein